MADERKQSPHYIPELDPENEKRPADIGARFFAWSQYAIIAVFLIAAVVGTIGWLNGWEYAEVSLIIAAAFGVTLILMFLG